LLVIILITVHCKSVDDNVLFSMDCDCEQTLIHSGKNSTNDKQHQTEINLIEQSIENKTLSSTLLQCTVISIIKLFKVLTITGIM
jgi:hypothetical protein